MTTRFTKARIELVESALREMSRLSSQDSPRVLGEAADQLLALHAEVERLTAKLKQYGNHNHDCPRYDGYGHESCSCGFCEALGLRPDARQL